jgi:hypothetical protein
MAANFQIGNIVRLNVAPPQGAVTKIQFNDAGEIEYLIEWTDAEGESQIRWFKESELTLV